LWVPLLVLWGLLWNAADAVVAGAAAAADNCGCRRWRGSGQSAGFSGSISSTTLSMAFVDIVSRRWLVWRVVKTFLAAKERCGCGFEKPRFAVSHHCGGGISGAQVLAT